MKNILVTGGAGYIGSHVVELLVKKQFKVFIIDNLSTGYKKLLNKKAKFFKVNINNYIAVKKIIKSCNIDSVIHLAAKLNVSEAEKKPKSYYYNNVTCTQNLILACKKTKVKNFIFSSETPIVLELNFACFFLVEYKSTLIFFFTKFFAKIRFCAVLILGKTLQFLKIIFLFKVSVGFIK